MASEIVETTDLDLPFPIPADWKESSLAECCEFIRDGDWVETKDQGGNDYRLLQISNIGRGNFVETAKYRWITSETFTRLRCTAIEEGDVLVARMPEPTGRAWHVATLPWPAVTAVDVAIIRTDRSRLDPQFVSYFLNSGPCLALIDSLTTGTTRRRIKRTDIERLTVPLPLLDEQRAIAHVLGTLDDKIELNRRMNATLEAMARAVFKDWFVDFGPVRAKLAGREPYLPPEVWSLFPDRLVDSELGEIPKGWEVGALGNAVVTTKGCSYRSKELTESETALVTLKSFARGGGYRPDGLKSFVGKYKAGQVVHPGEVVIACTDVTQAADVIGRPAIVQPDPRYRTLVASLDTLIIRPTHESMTRAFLYFLTSTAEFVSHTYAHTTGTTVLHLTKDAVPSFRFAQPPPRVVESFDATVQPTLSRIQTAPQESNLLAVLRDELLPKLVLGKVRIG